MYENILTANNQQTPTRARNFLMITATNCIKMKEKTNKQMLNYI